MPQCVTLLLIDVTGLQMGRQNSPVLPQCMTPRPGLRHNFLANGPAERAGRWAPRACFYLGLLFLFETYVPIEYPKILRFFHCNPGALKSPAPFSSVTLFYAIPLKRVEILTSNFCEMVSKVESVRLVSPRSISPIWLRWIPHISANSSCDQPRLSRSSRMREPSAF